MRINDFHNILEFVKQDILQSEAEYLKFLRVVGNNQRYDFRSQLSIYDRNPEATACAKFDYWRERFNRTVMRGQKGILRNKEAGYNQIKEEIEEGENHVLRRDDQKRNENERVLRNGEYGRDNRENQGEYTKQLGGTDGFHERIPESDLRSDETHLSFRERGAEPFRDASRSIQGEEADRTPDGYSKTSDRLYEKREAEVDGSLEDIGREQSAVQSNDFSFERDDNQGNSRRLKENIDVEIREADKASFSLPENSYGQMRLTIPLSPKDIDIVLINGGNHDGSRLPLIVEFSKGKSNEELGEYLKDTFKGGNGLYIDEREVSSWYSDKGIHLAYGTSAREDDTQILSWNDAASRINGLLNSGEFATNVELSEAYDYERDRISESLWYLYHDLSEEGKAQGYFDFIERGGGFPEETKRLSEALKNPEYLKDTIKEYSRFLAGYKENRGVLRFHYHKVDSLYQRLQELELTRKEYSTNLTELPKVKPFITDDEVLATLSRGSGIDKGKERITKFFKENHTLQEKANFLKDEYGIGGSSHAVSGAMGSDEWHDAKGLKLQKKDCSDVFLTWSSVAKHIDELLSKNLYLEEKKIESNTEIEEKESQYYSKDDPENLMTDEMLERVPELYAQEDVSLADKQVHAAYIIPLRSNWTWYMTDIFRHNG